MEKKILIIEDSEQDQKIVRRYLTKAGFQEIIFAGSAEEGVQKVKTEHPSIVVTDTNLPGMNGFEACKEIKSSRSDIKVIVVTGSIDFVDAEKARAMGADDYCVKTSDCAAILEAINSLIGQ